MKPLFALASIEQLTSPAQVAPFALSDSEAARLATFTHPVRRRGFLGGRLLARRLVTQAFPDEDAVLAIDPLGRTSVAGHPELYLSISHAGDSVACALSRAPIGVDIELASRHRGNVLALAAMVLSVEQCAELAAQQEAMRVRSFYQIWTLKEASLKRQGLGLDLALMRTMSFMPTDARHADALSLEHVGRDLILALVGSVVDWSTDIPEGWTGARYWRST